MGSRQWPGLRSIGISVAIAAISVAGWRTLSTPPSTAGIETSELPREIAQIGTKTYHNSSLNNNCAHPDFACGECETSLQDGFNEIMDRLAGGKLKSLADRWGELPRSKYIPTDPNVTLEDFLADVAQLMRATNKQSPGKLNYLVIGRSDSLQKTTPGHPRVILKSPDAELWLSFNTDPSAPGYNNVEVMRWDGKEGRYQFQEITFLGKKNIGVAAPSHIDLSGERCVQCHRSHLRPNWDTYRAWSGVVPPRDDYVEATPKPFNSYSYSPSGTPKLDGNALAYFNFLDRIADAKEKPEPNRLKILDIQYFEKEGLSERRKIEEIKSQVLAHGFYRIPHFPDTSLNANHSTKTADKAGPSHLAFDQLMGQQLCQVATSLKRSPDFGKIKYAVAGLVNCDRGSSSFSTLQQYMPEWAISRANEFFKKDPSIGIAAGTGPSAYLDALYQNTKKNHEQRDDHKVRRHHDYLKSYLTEVEHWSEQDAEKEAQDLSATATSGVSFPYSAISDPGGVKGVAESDTATIAALRFVLEPLGVKVSEWSMTLAENVADSSYAFSDQLIDILREQPVIRGIYDEASQKGYACTVLREASVAAFDRPEIPVAPLTELWSQFGWGSFDASLRCDRLGGDANGVQLVKSSPLADRLLAECVVCHSGRPNKMAGSRPWFDIPYQPGRIAELKSWLQSQSPFVQGRRALSWLETVQTALAKDHGSLSPKIRYQMPPDGFDTLGSTNESLDNDRREFLSKYLSAVASSADEASAQAVSCESIYSSQDLKQK